MTEATQHRSNDVSLKSKEPFLVVNRKMDERRTQSTVTVFFKGVTSQGMQIPCEARNGNKQIFPEPPIRNIVVPLILAW